MWLLFYILIWPAIALLVLVVLIRAFIKDLKQAKEKGDDLV